jgi:hypothetical protein
VDIKLEGCGRLADLKKFLHSLGRNPKRIGGTGPFQSVCGTHFDTIIPGDRAIRLCKTCCVKFGLIW